MKRYTQEDFEKDVHILRDEMLDALYDLQNLDDDPEFPEIFSTKEISYEPRTFMLFADGIVVDEQTGFVTNILDSPKEPFNEDFVVRRGLTLENERFDMLDGEVSFEALLSLIEQAKNQGTLKEIEADSIIEDYFAGEIINKILSRIYRHLT